MQADSGAADGRLAMPYLEFILLLTMMSALIALSVDTMLPALDQIGDELAVEDLSHTQLVISFLFLGMGLSQMFYGPLSDAYGRKPVVYAGLVLFIAGSILSASAQSFGMMLAGRVLQGIGVASPRVISMAIVRDLFVGRSMARVLSYSMSIFVLVPIIAPSIGQGIMWFSHWRMIFTLILIMAVAVLFWFALRLPETLPAARRVPLSVHNLWQALTRVVLEKVSMMYTLVVGLVFGVFLAYLSSAQQLFQGVYDTGNWFPLLFAMLAISMGGATFFNAQFVEKLGMRFLVRNSFRLMLIVSLIFLPWVWWAQGVPPLWAFMLYMAVTFLCVAIQFGNLSALAMEPLGDVAGMAAGIIGSLSTFIGMPIGVVLGRTVDTDVRALVLGFLGCALVGLLLIRLDIRADH